MPTSQTEGYFENLYYHFLEEPMFFLLPLKWNLYEKAFSSVKTKTNPNFAVNLLKGATILFYCLFDESHFSYICTLLHDCVNIWKRSEVAKQPFLYWTEWIVLNLWIFPVSIVKWVFGNPSHQFWTQVYPPNENLENAAPH